MSFKLINVNPPEGMTARDIRNLSDGDLLDMDYFLNENELDFDEHTFSFYVSKIELSYKAKKGFLQT
jgi:hypothetical protein